MPKKKVETEEKAKERLEQEARDKKAREQSDVSYRT
jgi:hypothetical protein